MRATATRITRRHEGRPRPRSLTVVVLVLLTLPFFALGIGPRSAAADSETPGGHELAPGLRHLRIEGGDTVATVAVIEPDAELALRTVVSNDRVGSGLERTSSMCARVDCLVAVNADFTFPGTRQPVGGVVRDGVMLRSPNPSHHQLIIGRDGSLAAGSMHVEATLVTTDLEPIQVDAVNTAREDGDLVLYTPAFGPGTGTNPFGTELVIETVRPSGPLALDETTVVELTELHDGGNAAIPDDGAVLSGHGAAARQLAAVWARARSGEIGDRVLLRLEADPDAFQSVGGTPVILRDGEPWSVDARTSFAQGRHPRTLVGWNDAGERFIVTVDGRQPGHSVGMSLSEAAALMTSLGATEAINLDGGGSTTFVVRGDVVNRPSDRLVERDGVEMLVPVPDPDDVVRGFVERPATTALAVVPRGTPIPSADPLADDALALHEVALPEPTGSDPASNPRGHLPAIVAAAPSTRLQPTPVALASAATAAAIASWTALYVSRRRRGAEPIA